MDGIGKVKIGQRAIIRLPAFPEQEFGFIEGKVISISPVPDSKGRYILKISMPRGLITNYGKELPLIKTISGTASIVTKEKTLLRKMLNFKTLSSSELAIIIILNIKVNKLAHHDVRLG